VAVFVLLDEHVAKILVELLKADCVGVGSDLVRMRCDTPTAMANNAPLISLTGHKMDVAV
jgi:hypothetical protein